MLLTIEQEPVGASYKSLLRFAREHSGSFSLVWRHQLRFDDSADSVEQALRPHFIEESTTHEWPGTKLYGHQASVRFYHPAVEAVSILERAGSLYAWLAPTRPEDLAFYTSARVPWLITISHERDAAIDPAAVDVPALRAAVPTLQLQGTQAAG